MHKYTFYLKKYFYVLYLCGINLNIVYMEGKVLHILGSLAIGGAENLVLDMIRQGRGNGWTFGVVYMHQSPAERINQFAAAGTDLKYIQCGKGIKQTYRFICNLRKYIKSNKVRVIHCHNYVDACWAFLAGCGLQCKIVLSVHGFNLDFDYLKNKLPVFGLFHPDKYILSHCSLAFVSKRTKDFYCEKYPELEMVCKAPVIYDGIDAEKILSAEKVSVCEEGLPVFAMVGSFNSPAKRQQLIICEAIGKLKKRFAGKLPFRFVFVGASNSRVKEGQISELPEGDVYAACRKYCRENDMDENIMFLPPRTDVPGIMRNLSGYIYASVDDTFGLSVIEAVIAGVPVLCSDIPTFREVTMQGELAKLVPNCAEDFAEAIVWLIKELEHGAMADVLLHRKEVAMRHYSIAECCKKYNSLYNADNEL